MLFHPCHKNGYIFFPHVRKARGVSNENLGQNLIRNVNFIKFDGDIFEKNDFEVFTKPGSEESPCGSNKF